MIQDKISREEVQKWLNRLNKKLKRTKSKTRQGEEILKNAVAYRDDCAHWLKNGNLFLAFECVIWAWAIVDTAEKLKEFFEDNDHGKRAARNKSEKNASSQPAVSV